MQDSQGNFWEVNEARTLWTFGENSLSTLPEMTNEYVLSVINQRYLPNIPLSVEMAAARHALHEAGLLFLVNDLIKALPEPARTSALTDWEYRPHVRRDSALVAQLAPALGLSEAQLDQLFIRAKELE